MAKIAARRFRRTWRRDAAQRRSNIQAGASFGMAGYFGSAVVAGGDGIPLKPDAQSLRACAARLGGHRLSSHDWMVGDSWTDMCAASNAGIKGAFCTFGFGRLNDSRFTVKINRFEELLRHLKAEE